MTCGFGLIMTACIQQSADVIMEIWINIPALKIKNPISHATAVKAAIIKSTRLIHSFYWYIEKMVPAVFFKSAQKASFSQL